MTEYPDVPVFLSSRLRPSPFFEATLRHGVTSFTVYNRMLLPMTFSGGMDQGYWDLVQGVSVWDVGCERQVEITGPDAAAFTQYLVTRDVSRIMPGSARYTLVCQQNGGILNDPVMLRLADDHFWLSLADSDIGLWAKGVAVNAGYEVHIDEPDVSPLQVQGPLSPDVMRVLVGEMVDGIGFYRFIETELEGLPMVIARTGWSGEVGFEIFLRDGSKGDWLWERVFEAGEHFGITAGTPNAIRRMEAGLQSWGTDMDSHMNPYEMNLGKFVDLDTPDDFIGKEALSHIAASGPTRRQIGLFIEGEPIRQFPVRWWPVWADGIEVGFVTSATWSPGMEANMGYAILGIDQAVPDREVVVSTASGDRPAVTTEIPFVAPRYRG